jgi:glycerol-3-phosphate acyltransferase PlsY
VMAFVGGGLVLAPLAGLIALAACLIVTAAARSFAIGARVGVFGFPLAQLLTGPVERVAATGALMTLIGLLFVLRGRGARASSARGAAPSA